jgi:hypothetical protein
MDDPLDFLYLPTPGTTDRPRSLMRPVGRGWRWWRALLTHTPTPYVEVPYVSTDEAGETAWAVGHWDRQWFLQALYDNARLDGWSDQLASVYRPALQITHTYRAQHTPDDDVMPVCAPDDPDAVRFTECVLVHKIDYASTPVSI